MVLTLNFTNNFDLTGTTTRYFQKIHIDIFIKKTYFPMTYIGTHFVQKIRHNVFYAQECRKAKNGIFQEFLPIFRYFYGTPSKFYRKF